MDRVNLWLWPYGHLILVADKKEKVATRSIFSASGTSEQKFEIDVSGKILRRIRSKGFRKDFAFVVFFLLSEDRMVEYSRGT